MEFFSTFSPQGDGNGSGTSSYFNSRHAGFFLLFPRKGTETTIGFQK